MDKCNSYELKLKEMNILSPKKNLNVDDSRYERGERYGSGSRMNNSNNNALSRHLSEYDDRER